MAKNNGKANGGTVVVDTPKVRKDLIAVLENLNPTATATDIGDVIAKIWSNEIKIISKDQLEHGIKPTLKEKAGVVVYTLKDGTRIEIDLARLFVGRKIEEEEKEIPVDENGVVNGGAAKANTAKKPQAKTRGKSTTKKEKEPKEKAKTVSGKAASAATAATSESKPNYRRMLLDEFRRINTDKIIRCGSVREFYVPRETPDGSEWETAKTSAVNWTLRRKGTDEQVEIYLSEVSSGTLRRATDTI